MPWHDPSKKRRVSLGVALALLLPGAVAAQAQGPRWTFRAMGFGADLLKVDEDDRYFLIRQELRGRPGEGVSVELRVR